MILTPVTKQISTLLPDGTQIKVFSAPWTDGEHRIGEKKSILVEYTTDLPIDDYVFYINPALFIPESLPNPFTNKPNYYYVVALPSSVGANTYPATISANTIDSFLPTYTNLNVSVITDGSNNFSIRVDFFMLHDLSGYMNFNGNTQVWKKFLNDVYNHPFLTPNNSNLGAVNDWAPNIYATPNISPRLYFYMEKSGTSPLEKTSREEKFDGFRAGYYYKNRTNTSPWFTNTYIELKRSGNVVTDFSDSQETEAHIFANTDNVLNPVTHFLAMIIRTDVGNLYQDFYSACEIDFQLIEASNTATGILKAPMTDPTDLGSNQWKATFKIAPVPFGQVYRIIGIAYSSVVGQPFYVNSFITGEIQATALPSYDGLGFDVKAALDDYNSQYDGNDLECVIEERMRTKLLLTYPFDKWKNNVFNRLGLITTNDIRRYLSYIKLEIYNEIDGSPWGHTTIKNIYDTITSNKTGTNVYSAPDGLTMEFGSTYAEFKYEFRNRFESNIPNIQTLIDGVNTIPVWSNQYWGGKTLKIKWILGFTYDNYATPFTDEIVIEQQIRVKDYGEVIILPYDGDVINKENRDSVFCLDREQCFGAIIDDTLDDRKLIVNVTPNNGNIYVLEEAEAWAGSQLAQLTTNKIINEEENFVPWSSDNKADFCLDGSNFTVGQYKISAIAKKYIEPSFRLTETQNDDPIEFRLTETNNLRIIN